MGSTSGVDCVAASSGCVEALEPQLQTRMLTLIFFSNAIFFDVGAFLERFWNDFGGVSDSKIRFFAQFFRKRRFCENRAPVEAKLLSLRFRAS